MGTGNNLSTWEVVPITIDCVDNVSAARIKLPENLQSRIERKTVERTIKECVSRFNGQIPELDPIVDMKINDNTLKSNIEELKDLVKRKRKHPLLLGNDFDRLKSQWQKKEEKRKEIENVRTELKKAKSLSQMEDLAHRKRVLRMLQYCDEYDVVLDKGRVACEVSASDELLLTEMLFTGVFNDLNVVYNWVLGESFEKIMNNTDVFEGSIIRCLRRLEDLLGELVNAAKIIGNEDLERKFDGARTAIKRDIPFAASLYL